VIPEAITTHETDAPALLTDAFRDKEVTRALVTVHAARAQGLEDVLWQVLEGFDLDTCEGAQLDIWGAIVDENRNGQLDTPYRKRIKVKILVLRSKGRAEDVIAVARLLDETAIYNEGGQLGWEVEIYDTDFGGDYVKALAGAKAVTSAGVLITSDWTGDLFAWDYI
jgi:hypothetical protein